ncbi:MAG: PAS domain S-box protein [Desulfarculaceae bacterium]|nr:PAS domain S-box protein [Desulfarculaceae bacterium]MCF8048723.1 PAS domain S-box protein [Desulfarculaceae bacterium]MCF8122012.1 PAS domain S-box protein [Desulfarculaceae bacterium]
MNPLKSAGRSGRAFSMRTPRALWLAMTFVVAVLLFALGWMTYLGYQDRLATAEQGTANSANALAEHMLRTMEGAEQVLYRAAALAKDVSWAQIAGSRKLCDQLRAVAASSPQIQAIWLADLTGQVRLISDRFPAPAIDISSRGYFRRTIAQGKGYHVGNPRRSGTTGRPYFSMAVALAGPGGKLRGVVAGAVTPPYLDDFAESLRLGRRGRAELITLEGVILTQAPARDWKPGATISHARVKQWLHDQITWGTYISRPLPKRGEHLVAFERLGSLPLAVVVTTSLSEVGQGYWRDNWARLAFSLLGIVLIALVFVALIRRAKVLAATTVSLDELQQEMKARQLAERTGRESSQAYRAIYENLADGLVLLDLDGQVLDCNHAFLERYGYSADQMQGRTLEGLVGVDQPELLGEMLQAAAQGQGVQRECRDQRKNGQVFFSEINTTVVSMQDQKRLMAILRDTTKRRQAEDKRERLLTRLEALWELYEHLDEPQAKISEKALATLLAITGSRHAFLGRVEQDRQRLVLEEYSRGVHGDCRTRQDSAHFPLADAGLWAEAIRRQESFIENNYADGGALHKGLPQGHLAIRNFMASPIVREGEVVSLVCLANKPGGFDEDDELMVDSFATGYWLLLERQQMERDLEEKAQQLERSNIELQQFAYVASHDLQEPLRMVSSYVQLLNRRYGDKLDQDAKEFIGFAVDGAERMRMLIQDLLAFSRVTTKGQPLEPTDSGRVLELALSNLQVIIGETGTKVEKGEMPQILADQGQLVQVFQNLVQNAIKFHGPQPPVVRIGAQAADGQWLFSVSDNGVGIEEQYFERIFIIYQRLHSKTEYGGTGIGLALVKKIVERHGGRIWVESSPGQGSTFYFTIPQE